MGRMEYQKLVKLTLDLDGGSFTNEPETEYLPGTIVTLESSTKEGYTFTGWTVTIGNSIVSGSTLTMGSKETTIAAIWEVNTYIVTLNANGGTISTLTPGYGGYSTGVVYLEEGERLYINVGGKGADNCLSSANGTVNLCNGGYNGGGTGYSSDCYKYVSGVGGATHIAKSAGELSTFTEETIKEVLIVAGGGGGVKGNDGNINNQTTSGANGGTQTTGYLIGQGETPATSTDNNSRAGGGGYYGGLSGTTKSIGAGGGSGYIGNVLLTNKVMYCYNCTESGDESTKTISTTNVSEDAISNYAKKGNGYAKITYIGETNDLN